jgi:hypothetical protein
MYDDENKPVRHVPTRQTQLPSHRIRRQVGIRNVFTLRSVALTPINSHVILAFRSNLDMIKRNVVTIYCIRLQFHNPSPCRTAPTPHPPSPRVACQASRSQFIRRAPRHQQMPPRLC